MIKAVRREQLGCLTDSCQILPPKLASAATSLVADQVTTPGWAEMKADQELLLLSPLSPGLVGL
jgi:hypothetical protein